MITLVRVVTHLEQNSPIIGNIRHKKNPVKKTLGPCIVEILDSTLVLGMRLKLVSLHTEQHG